MRGTFANIRLKNLMLPAPRAGVTVQSVRRADVDLRRRDEVPGDGRRSSSSPARVRHRLLARLAAKGTMLLGVKAVSRRASRDPPLEPRRDGSPPAPVPAGEDASTLGLTGKETFDVAGVAEG